MDIATYNKRFCLISCFFLFVLLLLCNVVTSIAIDKILFYEVLCSVYLKESCCVVNFYFKFMLFEKEKKCKHKNARK